MATGGDEEGCEVEVSEGGKPGPPQRPPHRSSWGSRSSTSAGGFLDPWRPTTPTLARRDQVDREGERKIITARRVGSSSSMGSHPPPPPALLPAAPSMPHGPLSRLSSASSLSPFISALMLPAL